MTKDAEPLPSTCWSSGGFGSVFPTAWGATEGRIAARVFSLGGVALQSPMRMIYSMRVTPNSGRAPRGVLLGRRVQGSRV